MSDKTIQDINAKIADGSVAVVTAEEMPGIVAELGAEGAAREVDIVTTGTFGAMCSSGAFLNLGHSDPPIKMQKVWFNDVEAYTGLAAIDAYMGATQLSETRGMEYGGAHVIEDLVAGKSVDIHATAYGTDCYPRKLLDTTVTIDDINQATMFNPRNGYQKYNVATNCSDRTLYTYMGTLLPDCGNATYSAAGVLSPMYNDPTYQTIGMGSRIFLCGAQGYVTGQGTQHDPTNNFATMMVQGDLKQMDKKYVRGATFHGYGTSLYVGIGIPIPILNADIAQATAITDADITTNVLDYGVARRSRPVLRQVNYEELKSGMIDINGKEVTTSPMSSFHDARAIAEELKDWIKRGEFYPTLPVENLPNSGVVFKPMKQMGEQPTVADVMAKRVTTIRQGLTVEDAAKVIMEGNFNHLPVVSDEDKLAGIITAWDIAKAVAKSKQDKVDDIMTREVVTADASEPIDTAARRLEQHNISAMPVVNKHSKVVGIITSDDISKLVGRR
ncbi:MAG: homocysteine biosynthesis protein [ANME-2 cluster archaeon]|nr:homocysteine biosynthesis protein [ANME-2 cluster archaeon]